MQIVNVKITEITPYKNNAKKHTKEQIQKVANSIKKFGFVQPLVLDKNKEIIIGHCRFEAGKLLKIDEVPCVMTDNLTDEEVKALRLADNKLNESAWDMDLALEELKLLTPELHILTGFDLGGDLLSDDIYTKKIVPPVYKPKNVKPLLSDLFDSKKTDSIIERINNSNLSDEEKRFLIYSAYRLTVFRFDKIVDFYLHSSKELRDIMEDLALVIIDFDKAIELGYVNACFNLFSNLEAEDL